MGLVYFVRAETLGLIKIGHAEDLAPRFSALRSQSPDRLRMLGVIETATARSEERRLHERFRDTRHHGEWFLETDALLALIAADARSWVDPYRSDLHEGPSDGWLATAPELTPSD